MGRFMTALLAGGTLEGGRLIGSETLAGMLTPQSTTRAGTMGLAFFQTTIDGAVYWDHDGATMTFVSQLLLSLENRFGVFVSYDGARGDAASFARELARRYFPRPPPSPVSTPPRPQPPPPPPYLPRPEEISGLIGTYQASRRSDSTIIRLGALMSQLTVARRPDGTVVASGTGLGAQSPLTPAGPRLFRDNNGRLLAFEDRPGTPTRIDIGVPSQQWERVPWYLNGHLVFPTVITGVAVIALTLLGWPLGALYRRLRRGQLVAPALPGGRLAVRVALLLQLGVVLATISISVMAGRIYALFDRSFDPTMTALYGAAWLGALGSGLPLWSCVRAWMGKGSSGWMRGHSTLLAACSLLLAWFFVTWHIAGTTLNY